MGMQGMFGERLFSILDKDADEILSKEEFIEGLGRLFTSDFKQNVKIVFDLFDFDNDGFITSEDLLTLLSHIPISSINPEELNSTASNKSPKRNSM